MAPLIATLTLAGGIVLGLLAVLLASATFVHFRGKARHKFGRQLLDHSTFVAPYNVMVYASSGVPNTPRQRLEDLPELAPLQEHWETIRDEAQALYDGGSIKAADSYNDLAFKSFYKHGWKRFYLKWYDEFLPSARDLCPKTVELVEKIPSIHAAMFTSMEPGGWLPKHRDPFAGSLRYHLGLLTPNDDRCRIYIDGEPYSWRDGEAIVFDETYIHWVRNETDESRVILFCDVERPIKNPLLRGFNRFASRHLVKVTATRNVKGEKVGFLNHVFQVIYLARLPSKRLKKANRKLYYLLKWVLLIGGLVLLLHLVDLI